MRHLLLGLANIKICIPELFYNVTIFVLLYLECQSTQRNSHLALDVINNISRDFRTILSYLSLKYMLLTLPLPKGVGLTPKVFLGLL